MKRNQVSDPRGPATIFPIRFVVRYNPPSIGLIYKRHQGDLKKRKYEIFLNGLITLPNSELIATQLYREHSLILSPEIVPFEQMQRLVEKILSNIEIIYGDEEENQEEDYQEGEPEQYVAMGVNQPYIDKNVEYIENNNNNNDLNKSFEIEKDGQENNEEVVEADINSDNFRGAKGRIGFLKNLRKK